MTSDLRLRHPDNRPPYNAYAPPQAEAPLQAQRSVVFRSAQAWAIGEVLSAAWLRFKDQWGVCVFATVVPLLVEQGLGLIPEAPGWAGILDP